MAQALHYFLVLLFGVLKIVTSSNTHLGCFADNLDDNVFLEIHNNHINNGPDACERTCIESNIGAAYFALQLETECRCGTFATVVDRHGELPPSDCTRPCRDGSSATCGGHEKFDAYRINVEAPPIISTPTPSSPAPTTIAPVIEPGADPKVTTTEPISIPVTSSPTSATSLIKSTSAPASFIELENESEAFVRLGDSVDQNLEPESEDNPSSSFQKAIDAAASSQISNNVVRKTSSGYNLGLFIAGMAGVVIVGLLVGKVTIFAKDVKSNKALPLASDQCKEFNENSEYGSKSSFDAAKEVVGLDIHESNISPSTSSQAADEFSYSIHSSIPSIIRSTATDL